MNARGTRRGNAATDRPRALDLRRAGWSVPDIAEELSISRSTAYLWVRHEPYDRTHPRSLAGEARRKAAHEAWQQKRRDETAVRRANTRTAAGKVVGLMDAADLIAIGAVMYWCEGSKAKPWRRTERVVFTNSDPDLIRVFLRFLEAVATPPETIQFRVAIHETADADAAVRWWADVVGAAPDTFLRTTLKRAHPKTVRHNTGDSYHGCLIVDVRRSRELYWTIEGVIAELVRQAVRPHDGPLATLNGHSAVV